MKKATRWAVVNPGKYKVKPNSKDADATPSTTDTPTFKKALVAVGGGLLLIALVPFILWYVQKADSSLQRSNQQGQQGLEVGKLLEQVRDELVTADQHRAAQAHPALFQMKSCDLEVSFVIKASQKRNGKVDYKMIAVDDEQEAASETTHKIILHFDTASPNNLEPHLIKLGSAPISLIGPASSGVPLHSSLKGAYHAAEH